MIDETLLDDVPVLSGLRPRCRRELAARLVIVRKGAGECFWRAGEHPRGILLLLTGRVRLVRSSGSGRRQVLHSEGPGVILGEVPFFDGGGYPATAEAEEPSVAILITGEALDAAMAADPDLARVLLGGLARRVRQLACRLESLATLDVRARLARHVLQCADRTVGTCAGFGLGATQAALAEELGTVREVVVRHLTALRRRGVLASAGRGRFTIVNRAALEAIADL